MKTLRLPSDVETDMLSSSIGSSRCFVELELKLFAISSEVHHAGGLPVSKVRRSAYLLLWSKNVKLIDLYLGSIFLTSDGHPRDWEREDEFPEKKTSPSF